VQPRVITVVTVTVQYAEHIVRQGIRIIL